MSTRRFLVQWCVSCVLLFSLSGCARTAPSRFYVLSPIPGTAAAENPVGAGQCCVSVAVGPIEVPEYLDRPQIVTRKGANEVHLAEFEKWAEPLEESLSRVLSEDLSALLYAKGITVFAWKEAAPMDYRVRVKVTRLDGELGKNVFLVVHWTILGKNKEIPLFDKKSSLIAPTHGSTYGDLVSATNRAVNDLSREIAEKIKALMKGP